MKKIKFISIIFQIILFVFLIDAKAQSHENSIPQKSNFIQLSGELFKAVQLSGIFKDSKTFVDAVPKKSPEEILQKYNSQKGNSDFDLKEFVQSTFDLPKEISESSDIPESNSMDEHIENLWDILKRNPESQNQNSTLLTLENPYIVPGGRFREIYYWDSFFTILGLLADNKISQAENMVHNFAYLLRNYKMIPNGNRVYYLTRSQPPFFSLMIDAICRYKNDYSWGVQFIDELEIEYSFWMDAQDSLYGINNSIKRVVLLNDGSILNRYFDNDTIPREESFKEDFNLAQKIDKNKRAKFYRDLRAAAESGWDFSSRWFADGKSISTIQTTDIIPVDLNCLLYFLEITLANFYEMQNEISKNEFYENRASKRKEIINKIFFNEEENFYFDYNFKKKEHTKSLTLSACFPLYFGIAPESFAENVKEKIEKDFLMPGGVITTLNQTKEQWDAPNGWAPLQWIAIKSSKEYGFDDLANEIKKRWLNLNENVFTRTGKMFEKYDVENLELFAGGGEYDLQDGFGWTNGIAAALLSNFEEKLLIKEIPEENK